MKEISAGGVVYRNGAEGAEVLLILDRYGKMTLPKGKLEAGETVKAAALREIREETGIAGRIVMPLAVIAYEYDHPKYGRIDKEVHYFLVEALTGQIVPQVEEIKAAGWHTSMKAQDQQRECGYRNNDEVLAKALAALQDLSAV